MSNTQNQSRQGSRRQPAASQQQEPQGQAQDAPYRKNTLQKMAVSELQSLMAQLEKQEADINRKLEKTRAQNTNLTQRITLLTKKSTSSQDPTNKSSQRNKNQAKGHVSIRTPDEQPTSGKGGQQQMVYVRKDHKDTKSGDGAQNEKSKQVQRQPKERPQAPEIFQEKGDKINPEVLKMREAVQKSWGSIMNLQSALTDAKAMSLPEGQSIAEEIVHIRTQIAKLIKDKEERAKKLVLENYSMQAEKLNMGSFVLTKILNSDAEIKTIWLLGSFKRDPTGNQAILTMRKTEFPESEIGGLFSSQGKSRGGKSKVRSEQYFHNSEYRKYWFDLPHDFSKVQCDVMYPASQKMIAKYTRQTMCVVRETADLYKTVVKPDIIEAMGQEHCNWVYAILNKEKELELRVHENDSFYLQKDYKFNEGDITTLYCLALPTQRDLFSIRDLTGEHLPLLKAMRDESLAAIESTFGVKKEKILSYFHYQPTFYHLHVHFVHVGYSTRSTRECVSLDEVIQNIEMLPDYYQRATMTYKVGTKTPFLEALVKKGIMEPEPIEEEKVQIEEVKEQQPAEESKETETKETATPSGDSDEKEEQKVAAASEETPKGGEADDEK